MTRCLPERTVDSWFASAVTRQLPDAGLWSPTGRPLGIWDHTVDAAGKAVIFECKGNEEGDREMEIDRRQLQGYIRAGIGHLVFYVLPVPSWTTPQNPLSGSQVRSWRSFERWAHVLPASTLESYLQEVGGTSPTWLRPAREQKHGHSFRVGNARLISARRLDYFLADLVSCYWVNPGTPAAPPSGGRPPSDLRDGAVGL